jgi:hypothetical protein
MIKMAYPSEQNEFLMKRFYQTASIIATQHEIQLPMVIDVMDANGADTKNVFT